MYSKYVDKTLDANNIYFQLDDIIERILNSKEQNILLDSIGENVQLKYEVSKKFETNQEVKLNEHNISYNVIQVTYETVKYGQEDNEMSAERLKETNATIIVYSDGIRTQYIINKARNSTALSILRKINCIDSKQLKVIEEEKFEFNDDFFIWLISKVREGNLSFESAENLSISQIIGFKGVSNQNNATILGTGNEIMDLFSTMIFLLEMDKMIDIEIKIAYNQETFGVKFSELKQQIDLNFDIYVGNFLMEEDYMYQPKLLLYTFMDVIPSMLDDYQNSKNNGDWNEDIKESFINKIAEDTIENINKVFSKKKVIGLSI